MSKATRFLEIEHKFVLAEDFDPTVFFAKVRALGPSKEYETHVADTYFLLQMMPHLVYRHRYDGLIQQLTTKSVSSRASEIRLEINLDLTVESNQAEAIRAFLEPFGMEWSGSLSKRVQVFYFDEIEIVYYQAAYRDKKVSCIELEARQAASIPAARSLLEAWELDLGLIPAERSHQSLLHLLVLETLPTKLRDKLASM